MKQHNSKTVILIAGPTAVGKTGLSLHLAKHFDTAIISADSRQCFREMNIGTAKPSAEELETVKHYFVNSHSIAEVLNAAIFEKLGLNYAREIFADKDIAFLCGGTGLYIKAFCEGIDQIPAIPEKIRQQIIREYHDKGLSWLQKELQRKDPAGYARAERQNPQRLVRALAVWKATGQSITDFQKGTIKQRDFNLIKIGLALPREKLWEKIRHRTGQMIRSGLLEEVKQLLPYRNLNALQTVGYKEIFEHLDEKYSLEEAIQAINIHTRQYAKRQLTWFKKDPSIRWFDPSTPQEIIDFISKKNIN